MIPSWEFQEDMGDPPLWLTRGCFIFSIWLLIWR